MSQKIHPNESHPNCVKCGLWEEGCLSPFMEGSGSNYPEIMVIGEAPGQFEDMDQILFHPEGKSGELLRRLLRDNDVNIKKIRFDNAVSCRPPKNRTPTSKEVRLCSWFLHQRIKHHKPRYILALGGKALEALSVGKSKRMTLKTTRHRVIQYQVDNDIAIPLIAGYHPSYAVRNNNNKGAVKCDIEFFAEHYHGKPRQDTRVYLLGENDRLANLDASIDEFNAYLVRIRKENRIVVMDFETNSTRPYLHPDFRVTALGLSDRTPDGKGFSICMRIDTGDEKCYDARKLQAVCTFLEDPTLRKVAHHAKYEMHVSCVRFGVQLKGLLACTLILHSCVYPMDIDRDLTSVVSQLLKLDPYDTEIKSRTHSNDMDERSDLWLNVPWNELSPYCAMDCASASLCYYQLWKEAKVEDKRIKQRLKQGFKLTDLFTHLMMPALHVLQEMEQNGMLVDMEYSNELEKTLRQRMEDIKEKCRKDIPYVQQFELDKIEELISSDKAPKTEQGKITARKKKQFNPGSAEQCGELIFGENYFAIGCPQEWRTNTGRYSVTKDILDILEEENEGLPVTEFIRMKKEYESTKKDVGTYVTGVLKRVSPKDHRVRSTFLQSVASTGRLSSRDPNLQNIKSSTELKRMYVAPKGYELLAADYSQMELRVLAAMSGDEGFMEAFKLGRDIHDEAARKLFHVPSSKKVTKQQRRLAKNTNFGIVYGISPHGLARNSKVMYDQAEDLINSFYEAFTGVTEWQEKTKNFAARYGCVYTLFGRRRILENCKIRPRTREEQRLREEAFRQAMNMPIQGTASDMCLVAMIRLKHWIQQEGLNNELRLVNSIHDSILFEVLQEVKEDLTKEIKSIMLEEPMKWVGQWFRGVPIEVEITSGTSWGEL